jgi:lipid-A-disaccharide synthase
MEGEEDVTEARAPAKAGEIPRIILVTEMGPRRVFISAGELSGDIAGARLVAELRRRDPGIYLFGTGGRRMAAAGLVVESDTNDIGVVGVTEALATLPSVVRAYRAIRRRVLAVGPSAAVLIGNDVFNVFLARALRRLGIPTIAFFPPQVWVWRSLAGFIARSFDAIVTSFPDEHAVYRDADATALVSFAGHYLVDDLHAVTAGEREQARAALAVPQDATVIGLFPGSRRNEWSALTPVLLDAAARLAARDRSLRFVVAAAETADADARQRFSSQGAVTRVSRDGRAVMQASDLLLMASGTATLEAALVGVPMVIAYKVSAITHACVLAAIRAGLIETYRVGLPNLVLGTAAVPELLQGRATGAAIADEAWQLLSEPSRLREMRTALAGVGIRLRGAHPIEDVADAVLSWADGRRTRAARLPRVARTPRAPRRSLRATEPE